MTQTTLAHVLAQNHYRGELVPFFCAEGAEVEDHFPTKELYSEGALPGGGS